MPAKYAIKEYETGGYYHIYNRGVDRRTVFETEHDYKTFLSYLKLYLMSPDASLQGESLKVPPSRKLKNYFGEIELLCYCLMPNHFHLFVKQNSERSIDHSMRSLGTKYVRYFNSRYHRLGPLFQGPYKAVRVNREYQFIYLSKYIHRNPLSIFPYKESPRRLSEYSYSSYGNYLRKFSQSWLSTTTILAYFSKTNRSTSYESFVEEGEADDVTIIASLALDLQGESS